MFVKLYEKDYLLCLHKSVNFIRILGLLFFFAHRDEQISSLYFEKFQYGKCYKASYYSGGEGEHRLSERPSAGCVFSSSATQKEAENTAACSPP